MKTTKRLVLAGLVLAALSGCIPVSLHPFYEKTDLVFEPELVGVWAEKDKDTNYWAFAKGGDQNYRLEIVSNGEAALFDARAFKLGTNLFLDIYPDEKSFKECKLNDMYGLHLVPVHSLARITEHGATLRLAFLDLDWLTKLLQEKPTVISHTRLPDDRIVLTATTSEMQEFVLKHLDKAFDQDPEGLKRVPAKP